ncbi:hypothetical protein [uncultured Arthrobacter sp.]|uniref:hypothetical protein n=1 Tax=uncultured Arthrobacter sp. TaxID=114050 RepID=UPI0028D7155D|nr:hypothetical protein [uncultured Arthrobacter sp.]
MDTPEIGLGAVLGDDAVAGWICSGAAGIGAGCDAPCAAEACITAAGECVGAGGTCIGAPGTADLSCAAWIRSDSFI